MRKNKKKNRLSSMKSMRHQATTLREANTGVKEFPADSILRLQHLRNLAKWAIGEAGIPSLGAWYGCRFAASSEEDGVSIDSPCFTCQRCETFLQPGLNCTVRIEKNLTSRRRQNTSATSKNFTVYTCHYCSYRNLKMGSKKGHLQQLLASSPKPEVELNSKEIHQTLEGKAPELMPSADVTVEDSAMKFSSPSKKKRKSRKVPPAADPATPKALPDSGKSGGTSRKRRRKGWSSLEEITEANEVETRKSICNIFIPFSLAMPT